MLFRTHGIALLLFAVVGASVASASALSAAQTLTFTPQDTVTRSLQVAITAVLLNDAPTGMTGGASAQCKLSPRVLADPGVGTALRLELSKLDQQMAGRRLNVKVPPPALLQVDRRGRLLELPGMDTSGQPVGEILSQGGVPLQTLAVLCALPQLPDGDVDPGDTWKRTDSYDLPGLGLAKVTVESTFVGIKEGVAVLKTHLVAQVPDFQADNPLGPGQKITVSNLVLDLADLTQLYDLTACSVTSATGTIKASMDATTADIVLPVKVQALLKYGE
ncbi:MAG TPA: hypothetical protein VGM19_07250 [Armatimonadota bacterium]|jgi:hypothetical protein